ncbi:hypothetical protein AGMMS4956_02350 [Bacteroidia bacterium]|nr:hypothetical protein AGMMS4956_02350 [Bacteroidia bacterium]
MLLLVGTTNALLAQGTSTNVDSSICSGSSYSFAGNPHTVTGTPPYTTTGTYTATYTAASGGDSIVNLNLTVCPSYTFTQFDTACVDEHRVDPWGIGGMQAKEGTQIRITTKSTTCGCDSTYIFSLTGIPQLYYDTVTLRGGEKYYFFGKGLDITGIDTFAATLSCPPGSVVHLKVIRVDSSTRSICATAGPVEFGGKQYNTTGIYRDTIRKTVGNDTIKVLNLTVRDSIHKHFYYSFCYDGSNYTFADTYGNSYNLPFNTSTGIYQGNKIKTQDGVCDSIIIWLHVAINHPVSINETIEICDNELPYTYRDTTLDVAGTYVFHRTSSLNCDSTVTLTFVVNPTYKMYDTLVICNSDLPYRFDDLTTFEKGTTTQDIILYRKTANGCNCDSLIYLALTVNLNVEFTITHTVACADDATIFIEHTLDNTVLPALYSITFEEKSKNYFTDIVDVPYNTSANTPIFVNMPLGLPPGVYPARLHMTTLLLCGTEQPFNITVNYPSSVIAQKWNDVLAIYKIPDRYFSAYQWFKNDEELYGATHAFLHETPALDFTGRYAMRFTHTDGEVLFSCPFTPSPHDESPDAYPTLVSASHPFFVDAANGGEAIIRNAQGTVESRQFFAQGRSAIAAPATAGLYFVELKMNNNTLTRILKIVVK